MPVSFYYGVRGGLEAILIPWFTTYAAIASVWIVITLRTLKISIFTYLHSLRNAILGTTLMAAGVVAYGSLLKSMEIQSGLFVQTASTIGIGAIVYVGYLWIFDRRLIYALRTLR